MPELIAPAHPVSLALRSALFGWASLLMACVPAEDPLPPVRIEGTLITYAAEAEVCTGTVLEAEQWLRAVATELSVSEDQLLPIHFYQLEREEVRDRCNGQACAIPEGDAIVIYSTHIIDRHELVHAIHLSAYPRRPPLLEEGLATMFDDHFSQRFATAGDAESVAQRIELVDPRDDPTVYPVGAYLSYWIRERYGQSALTELWDTVGSKSTAEAFEQTFAELEGETLEQFLSAVDGEFACQIVTCYGTPTPWDNGSWGLDVPGGCDDDSVIGVWDADGGYFGRTALVEITEPGIYELSTSSGVAFLGRCGSGCEPLVGGDSNHAAATPEFPANVVLNVPGLYRVQVEAVDAVAGLDRAVLRPSP